MAKQLLLSIATLLVLASAIPAQHTLPSSIPSSDVLLSESTNQKQMVVVLSKTQLNIYKLETPDSYRLIQNKPICQASSLVIPENRLTSNDLSSYHVIIGCKNGYFYVYEVSLTQNQIINSFAKKLDQPIEKIVSAIPYLFISTNNILQVFNIQSKKIEQRVPIVGGLSQIIFDQINHSIVATDFISDIRIKFNQLSKIQINKMPKSIINDDQTYSHVRLLQINGTTAVCGNGQLQVPEQCDDGNTVDGDGCSSRCANEFCGDGVVNNNGTEDCDPGLTADSGCVNCKLACGNGVVDTNQECDDGNRLDGDGCSSLCSIQQSENYKSALGVGIGVGFAGVVGVIAGTSVGSATGVASSLIGTAPASVVSGLAGVSGGAAAAGGANAGSVGGAVVF